MAYKGYLLKVGDFEILAEKYIQASSYSVLYSVTDIDSYRNANGELIRTALTHRVPKIEFSTVTNMSNIEFADFMSNIRRNYVIPEERKVQVDCYIPEIDNYITTFAYMPDITPKINRIDENKNIIYYDSIRISFIGY